MNLKRRNVVLGGLCAVLSIVTIVQLSLEGDAFVDVGRIPLMFDGFTSDNVGTVWLMQPQAAGGTQAGPDGKPAAGEVEHLVVKLVDGGWHVAQVPDQAATDLTGAPVMKSRIENSVFEHLREIRRDPDTLVQPDASEEQLREFGLDDEHAFVVRCLDRSNANVVAELLVGNEAAANAAGGQAVNGVFVRARDSNDVVLYELDRPWQRDIDPEGWLDRVLLRLEPDKVRSLSIRNASTKGTFTFVREPNQARWQATAGAEELGALRQSEIETLVQRFRYVAAQRFVRPMSRLGDAAALGLFPSQIEIELQVGGASERKITIEVGDRVEGRNEFYMTCSEVPFLLTWPASNVTQFELDIARRLFDPKPK